MGFVGGGGYIAIATALPPSYFVYFIVNIKSFMEFLYLIFYPSLRLRFLDVKINLLPFRGWFQWPSSRVVGFYYHEPSWSCSLWLRNCLRFRTVGCRPNPCTWCNTWPPDDRCSWPSTGCCCSTDRKLRLLLSVGSYFDGSGVSKLVYELESFPETSSQFEYCLWCNTGTALSEHLACWQSCWGFEQTSVPAGWTLYTNKGHPCA